MSDLPELPKSKLLWIKRRPMHSIGNRPPLWWAKFRCANAMFVWIGPVEIGWRMPWLPHVRDQLYPEWKSR